MNPWIAIGIAAAGPVLSLLAIAVSYGRLVGRVERVEHDVARIERDKASNAELARVEALLQRIDAELQRSLNEIKALLTTSRTK